MDTSKIPPMPPLESTPDPVPHSPRPNENPHASVKPKRVETLISSQQSETMALSPNGQKIKQYTKAMADIPDIRQDRINQIQTTLKKGGYSVSAQDLADKMLQEISSLPSDPSSKSG